MKLLLPKFISGPAIAALSVVLISGCSDSSNPPSSSSSNVNFDADAMITNLVDNVIVAGYSDLNTKAADLIAAVTALDTITNNANMSAAQQAWVNARAPWESGEGFIFGPVDSLGVDPAIDSWPLNTSDLQTFLTANPTATQTDVENASDDVRGYHAMEWLLFGDGIADNEKDSSELVAAESNYLVALSDAYKAQTQALIDAWTVDFNGQGPYADQAKSPGPSKAYGSDLAVVEEFIGGIVGIVAEVGEGKIPDPFTDNIGTADTSKVESQYSWNSLTDFHDNIGSVLDMYTGIRQFDVLSDTLSDSNNGLYSFVLAHDSVLADRVYDEIIAVLDAIALIDGDNDTSTTEITDPINQIPFRQAILVADGRIRIQAAIDALVVLQATIENDVAGLLTKTDFM